MTTPEDPQNERATCSACHEPIIRNDQSPTGWIHERRANRHAEGHRAGWPTPAETPTDFKTDLAAAAQRLLGVNPTGAELDASMLEELRQWYGRQDAEKLASRGARLEAAELDMLLRVAAERDDLRNEVRGLRDAEDHATASLTEERDRLKAERDDLRLALATARKAADIEKERLTREVAEAVDRIADLNREIERLDRDRANRDVNSVELASARREIETLRTQLENVRQHRDTIEAELEDLRAAGTGIVSELVNDLDERARNIAKVSPLTTEQARGFLVFFDALIEAGAKL